MNGHVLALHLMQIALLVLVLVCFIRLRTTIRRSTSNSVADRARCLELATQWNQSLLEQVAALSKQNIAMREALHFYAQPENWSAAAQAQSPAFADRGDIARITLCAPHVGGSV